jgi:hypothetical protein
MEEKLGSCNVQRKRYRGEPLSLWTRQDSRQQTLLIFLLTRYNNFRVDWLEI